MRRRLAVLAVVVGIPFVPLSAHGQWQSDGVPLSNTAGGNAHPKIISDGAGGAIVTWEDNRNGGNLDIYAQRLDATGLPQWGANAVALCVDSLDQLSPTIVSDGAGGAIVTWDDYRNGTDSDIYAQRIDATGLPQWGANGVAVCANVLYQLAPTIVSDGAGGAIVTWYDTRGGYYSIYAQRVNASGVAKWKTNGVQLCTGANARSFPTIVSDDAGGAIVAWQDGRSGTNFDIYARRVTAAGVPQWTANGVALCTAAYTQSLPTIVSDGAGGAIVTWQDHRSGTGDDVYAQRVDALGVPQWAANGVALCVAWNNQQLPAIVSDGAGGAIVAWEDSRSALFDIYAQRVDTAGTPTWTTNGVGLCTAGGDQFSPMIVSDDAGGAIVTWSDSRSVTNEDIYAQRVNASGLSQWPATGVALCTDGYGQQYPAIATDGGGGAIVTWKDYRSYPIAGIYALRMGPSGLMPTGVGGTSRAPSLVVGMNYPNPFSTTTSLDLQLPAPSDVSIEIVDVAGRRQRSMTLNDVPAGPRRFEFDGRNDEGRRLSSGVYFCKVTADGETTTRKMVIAR